MITIPSHPAPNGVTVTQVDFGLLQRGALGSVTKRLNRAGNRHALEVSFPIMKADVARVFVSRLQLAVGQGLKMELPLLGVSQGNPGTPLVNGTGVQGTSLPVDGLTPGYVAKEGYWINVTDAAGGIYLHNISASVAANNSGEATLTIWPPLRAPILNNSAVNIAKPYVEGYVGEIRHELILGDFIQVGFTLEEDK